MIHSMVTIFLIVLLSDVMAGSHAQKWSDQQIRQQMIRESIADYGGRCPCPYHSAKNGSRCGKRSAWSRAGGASPLCYEQDITAEMLREWKARNAAAPPDTITR